MEIIDAHGHVIAPPNPIESLETRHPQPHQSLGEVLRTVCWASAQYGLFRTEALRKTRLIDAFYMSDYVLLAELSLLGEIWHIPEVLFQRRHHPDVTSSGRMSTQEMLAWFDPLQKAGTRRRMGVEYLRSISRLQLSTWERLMCYLTVVRLWYGRQLYERFGKWTTGAG
jgi:hypothetical protein